jgi:hypothetical protein
MISRPSRLYAIRAASLEAANVSGEVNQAIEFSVDLRDHSVP